LSAPLSHTSQRVKRDSTVATTPLLRLASRPTPGVSGHVLPRAALAPPGPSLARWSHTPTRAETPVGSRLSWLPRPAPGLLAPPDGTDGAGPQGSGQKPSSRGERGPGPG